MTRIIPFAFTLALVYASAPAGIIGAFPGFRAQCDQADVIVIADVVGERLEMMDGYKPARLKIVRALKGTMPAESEVIMRQLEWGAHSVHGQFKQGERYLVFLETRQNREHGIEQADSALEEAVAEETPATTQPAEEAKVAGANDDEPDYYQLNNPGAYVRLSPKLKFDDVPAKAVPTAKVRKLLELQWMQFSKEIAATPEPSEEQLLEQSELKATFENYKISIPDDAPKKP